MKLLLIVAAVILLFIAALFLGLFLLAKFSMTPADKEMQRLFDQRV